LRLPIGQFDQFYGNVLLPIDLQPSAGSYRYNPGLVYYQKFSNPNFNVYVNSSLEFAQAIQTDRTNKFKYGDLYLFSLGGNYKLSKRLGLNLELRDQIRKKSVNNKVVVNASGGNVLFMIPRVSYTQRNWVIQAGMELPVYKNLSTIGYPQLSNKYAWNIGVKRSFKLIQDFDTTKFIENSKVVVQVFYVNGKCGMCKS